MGKNVRTAQLLLVTYLCLMLQFKYTYKCKIILPFAETTLPYMINHIQFSVIIPILSLYTMYYIYIYIY